MNGLSIGISAIASGQRALDIIGQNIANATTPGYHRQAVNLTNRVTGDVIGTGVDVASITRYESPPARAALLRGNGEQGDLAARLGVRRQVEALLGTGEGGIGDGIDDFFNQVEQLTSRPDDTAVRRTLLGSADVLARQFNAAGGDLDRLRRDLGGEVKRTVSEVNDFAKQIADLNHRIEVAAKLGNQPNDLIDQRDQLVDQLSQRIDVRTVSQPFGVVNVISSEAVVVGEFANEFAVNPDATGNLVVTRTSSGQPVSFTSGKLAGLLREHNQDLPATRARLGVLAGEFVRRVNAVQATGLGTTGPLTSAAGTIGVADPAQPLATQNLPFPIQSGQLTVSVTDTATGNRTNTAVAIDPTAMSLNDVATALSGVTGLSASVDAASGTLRIAAQPGFAFDFAGRDTNPPGGGAVANPDTAGVLAGLGVNGLFTGTDAAGIAVRSEIIADPRLLAASRTGQPGDGTNLERLAAVRDQVLPSGATLGEEFADLATSVGSEVKGLGDREASQSGVLHGLAAQEQSVTGVDLNEELVNLLSYQRMVEGASRYMSVVNSALDSIMGILD